jgi:uncharacterized protein (TIGR00255 family)
MTLASMTGFARADGSLPGLRWSWELKTVNARGLDIRMRTPPGLEEALETGARSAISARLMRGACQVNLSVQRESRAPAIRINPDVLDQVEAALDVLRSRIDATPPSLDGLLAVKGLVEIAEPEPDPDARAAEAAAMLASLDQALDALVEARRREGSALAGVLADRINLIQRLAQAADDLPARAPDAIRARLAEQIRALTDAAPALSEERLYQEAVLLAAKADIREELDRLHAHVAAAREMLASGQSVGRRLDFLAQELGRESNTLCAKSNDVELTAIGLELKVAVEQFREQVQNVE